jgi:hypothetical protein
MRSAFGEAEIDQFYKLALPNRCFKDPRDAAAVN